MRRPRSEEELNLEAEAPTLIGVYPFEQMNQVIIAFHVRAIGIIHLNQELDDFKYLLAGAMSRLAGGEGLGLAGVVEK
jgi:hypothetical protein